MTMIFISYAREDVNAALRIYDDLKSRGYRAWLDQKDILPGERWKTSIKRAIFESSVFLALMSKNSVSKKGFVQKELREAIEVLERLPEGDIFLIPIRLDDCQPSHNAIGEINWVDLFDDYEEGFEQILKAVNRQLKPVSVDVNEGEAQKPRGQPTELLPPLCTSVGIHSTSGAAVITLDARPQVQYTELGPVDLEFDLTNQNRVEMALSDIYVEVMEYRPVCLVRTIPYMGLGQARKYSCTIEARVGSYSCVPKDKSYDFIKMASGELERFGIAVDASCDGLYRLAVSVRCSVAGMVREIRIGCADGFIAFHGNRPTVDVIVQLKKVLDDTELSVRKKAALEVGRLLDNFENMYWIRRADLDSEGYVTEGINLGGQSSRRFSGEAIHGQLVPTLIAALSDDNEWVQRDAVRFLGNLGGVAAVPALVSTLDNSSIESEVIRALGHIGSAALPELSEILKDSAASRRAGAVQAMAHAGAEAVPLLERALFDREELVRRLAVESLGQIATDDAVCALLPALDDSAASVRAKAATALGYTKKSMVAPSLRVSLTAGNTAAAHALSSLSPPDVIGLKQALTSRDSGIRLASVKALGGLWWLFTNHPGARELEALLPQLKKSVLEALEQGLTDDSSEVRRSAAAGLGELGSSAMVQLGQALEAKDSEIRKTAAKALVKVGTSALPTLIGALEGSDVVQETVFRALRRLGQPAREALQHASLTGNERLRSAATTLLDRIEANEKARYKTATPVQRLPCDTCGAMILPGTSQKTGGLCMPCYQGRRGCD